MRKIVFLALCASLAACGGKTPTGPTPKAPRIARTRFVAFGDSITAGEVTQPVSGLRDGSGQAGKLIVVPAASYPSVLQSKLTSTYTGQATSITVTNAGVSNEAILDGVTRFAQVFPSSGADVVLLQEGVNNLNFVGPDTSTGLMRIMVQQAKSANAKVYVGSMIPTVPGRPRAEHESRSVDRL